MNSVKKQHSLMEMAGALFDRCNPEVARLSDEELPDAKRWEESLANQPSLNVNNMISLLHARLVLSTREPSKIEEHIRSLMAGCIAVSCRVRKKPSVTLNGVLSDADDELRQLLDDNEALQSVETAQNMAKDAEAKAVSLVETNNQLELTKMGLEEIIAKLTAENQKVTEELQTTKVALSDAQAQLSKKAVPPITSVMPAGPNDIPGLREEFQNFRRELTESWINSNRDRVKMHGALAEAVSATVRLIQADPAVMEAIQKSPLVGPAFKFVEQAVPAIPG